MTEFKKELTLYETQQILAQWLIQTGLFSAQSPEETLDKAREEIIEVEQEICKNPTDKEALGKEIADVIWTAINLATLYGIDINEMMLHIMHKNFNRYNPYKAQKLQESGLTVKDSLKQLKADFKANSGQKQ